MLTVLTNLTSGTNASIMMLFQWHFLVLIDDDRSSSVACVQSINCARRAMVMCLLPPQTTYWFSTCNHNRATLTYYDKAKEILKYVINLYLAI